MRVLPLALAAAIFSGVTAILIYLSGLSSHGGAGVSEADLAALSALQGRFSKCVDANGLGLKAVGGEDYCRVVIQYPSDTVSKWKDPKTGETEGLSFEFNLCEAVASWEQVRNSTTVLTKEYIDAMPNGWEEYAWRRINKGILLNKCQNRTLCMEKLSLVLPETSPYVPRQFSRCAVVGNSGDLLKTKFGDEIDSYDVVIRENGAPIQNYTEYVGTKSTFRLLNRGSAKALDKVVELDETKKEVLIVKTTIHDIMNQMIRELPITNPVYLMLGTSFGSSAKGTGLKALEFALSICDSVDMYGFTVDPGYKEWTRYFSESRKGHTPLYGRAYYQMMECLGLVKIHSPMRGDPGRVVKWLPTKDTIEAARVASEKLLKRPGAGSDGPLGTCTMIKKREKGKAPNRSGLGDATMKHLEYMKGATRYPLERNAGGGYLCMINDR
ncbi:sialyltransferase-like protein 4 [Phragmites australis]|uniref:sialyltransferase-like protein 4 n=1 Tax=Phragmites australis TaxID=29695 RepID=UPI002D780B73|nr:sialyltransferase-like protein 4 [Phragmites australis]